MSSSDDGSRPPSRLKGRSVRHHQGGPPPPTTSGSEPNPGPTSRKAPVGGPGDPPPPSRQLAPVAMRAGCASTRQFFVLPLAWVGGTLVVVTAQKVASGPPPAGHQQPRIALPPKSDDYPGCPWCGNRDLVSCGCGAVTCWSGSPRATCHACGNTGEVGQVEHQVVTEPWA